MGLREGDRADCAWCLREHCWQMLFAVSRRKAVAAKYHASNNEEEESPPRMELKRRWTALKTESKLPTKTNLTRGPSNTWSDRPTKGLKLYVQLALGHGDDLQPSPVNLDHAQSQIFGRASASSWT